MQLIINAYEFGQWLRILLWIGVPLTVFLTMLTTWLHYRRERKLSGQLLLSIEGGEEGDERVDGEHAISYREANHPEVEGSYQGEEEFKENMYKGMLWMKEKYEQYRDLADQRYERLKEQLARIEKKYEDLLESIRSANPKVAGGSEPALATEAVVQDQTNGIGLTGFREEVPADIRSEIDELGGENEIVVERAEMGPGPDRMRIQGLEEQLARTQQRFDEEVARLRYQLDEEIGRGRRLKDEKNAGVDAIRLLEQQVLHSSRQLEEKQRMIADLEGQLTTDKMKIEELVTKLRNNSQLLMNIYQELDKSLHFSDGPPQG